MSQNARIPCALCDDRANEFCMVEIPVEGIGNLAVYFCEEHFRILTPRFIEFGYLHYATYTNEGPSERQQEEDR
jgi:hypothetical protein